jgi:hypothetical protein
LPQNTYHFRVKVENELGVSYGEDMIFETDPISHGQTLGGGIVFYIDGTGEPGFICAPINQAQRVPWDNGTQILKNTSTSIGTGKPNTAALVVPRTRKLCGLYPVSNGTKCFMIGFAFIR